MTSILIIRTAGTRLTWSSPLEWIAAAQRIEGWRISIRTYRARVAHMRALAWGAGAELLELQPLEELLALEAFIKTEGNHYRPPAGLRAGSDYVQVLNTINRAVARIRSGKL